MRNIRENLVFARTGFTMFFVLTSLIGILANKGLISTVSTGEESRYSTKRMIGRNRQYVVAISGDTCDYRQRTGAPKS
jgi:hypothetical protein